MRARVACDGGSVVSLNLHMAHLEAQTLCANDGLPDADPNSSEYIDSIEKTNF